MLKFESVRGVSVRGRDGYRRLMFRTLVMFPASADQRQVDELIARTAAAFKNFPVSFA